MVGLWVREILENPSFQGVKCVEIRRKVFQTNLRVEREGFDRDWS